MKDRLPLAILTLAVVILYVGGALLAKSISDQSYRADRDMRAGQYEACEKVGNALRHDIREEFADLKRSVLIPAFVAVDRVFVDVARVIPAADPRRPILRAAHGTLTRANTRMRHRIDTIDQRIPDTHCQSVYPPLSGQSFDQKP